MLSIITGMLIARAGEIRGMESIWEILLPEIAES